MLALERFRFLFTSTLRFSSNFGFSSSFSFYFKISGVLQVSGYFKFLFDDKNVIRLIKKNNPTYRCMNFRCFFIPFFPILLLLIVFFSTINHTFSMHGHNFQKLKLIERFHQVLYSAIEDSTSDVLIFVALPSTKKLLE
jgi:hypothetical protein